MGKQLLILTNSFPFQKGEEFLITESKYYEGFDKVFICPIYALGFDTEKKYDKEKCDILRIDGGYDKYVSRAMWCLRGVFTYDFWKEIIWLAKKKEFSFFSIYQLLAEVEKSLRISHKIQKKIGNILDNKDTVVYSYWLSEAKIAIELKKKHRNIKVVSRAHGGDLYEFLYKSNYLPFRRMIFLQADKIYPISINGLIYIKDHYFDNDSKLEIARLGVEKVHEVNQNYPKRDQVLKIVSCSYCRALKRIDLIIDALSGLNIEIEWVHIGDGDEFNNLKKKAEDTMPPNIHYSFIGYVDNKDIQKLYLKNQFHVFINVSETEGIPVSIMEALSCSIPVIATNVGGVAEMVQNNYNGMLLPKTFEISELIACINSIKNLSEAKYQELRQNAWDTWNTSYNAKENYTKFVKQILSLSEKYN